MELFNFLGGGNVWMDVTFSGSVDMPLSGIMYTKNLVSLAKNVDFLALM